MYDDDSPALPDTATRENSAPAADRRGMPAAIDRPRGPRATPHILALILLALIATVPFWVSDLDIHASAFYFHPDAVEPWPVSQRPLWIFMYQLSPLIAALMLLGGLGVLIAGSITPQLRRLRPYALFVVALYAIGPGLLVNSLLKENWGRPRPHQIEQFGFAKPYLPPLALGIPGEGKSFPCGHSSVGYALSGFFLLWLRRRPWLAAAVLGVAILVGTLIGVGRMTAGDHFLSDVLWSGVIVYGLALLLYYPLLRIPRHEAAWEDRQRAEAPPSVRPLPPASVRPLPPATIAGYVAAAAAIITGVLLATPVAQQEVFAVDAAGRRESQRGAPRVLRIEVDTASFVLYWLGGREADHSAIIWLKARGFGLPGTRVDDAHKIDAGAVTYRFWHKGVFTEKDTKLVVGVVADDWDRIELSTGAGDIRVHETTVPIPLLDLDTGRGNLLRPNSLVPRRAS